MLVLPEAQAVARCIQGIDISSGEKIGEAAKKKKVHISIDVLNGVEVEISTSTATITNRTTATAVMTAIGSDSIVVPKNAVGFVEVMSARHIHLHLQPYLINNRDVNATISSHECSIRI